MGQKLIVGEPGREAAGRLLSCQLFHEVVEVVPAPSLSPHLTIEVIGHDSAFPVVHQLPRELLLGQKPKSA